MLTASAATIDILLTSPNILVVDLFKFTLPNGAVLRWSGGDRVFTVASGTYLLGPGITRTSTKRKVGIDVDTITVSIIDNGSTTLNGRSILRCLHEGEFDGALVEVERLFLNDWDDLSPGAVPWFAGFVSSVSGDQGKFELRVKSMLGLLDIPMPRFLYKPACNNTFGDASCGKSKIALTQSGAVAASSSSKTINLSGAAAGAAAGTFDLGVVKALTGANAGLTRTIRKHTSGVIEVSPAFPNAFATGDSLSLYPSCYKTRTKCVAYANEGNFRGYPFVPAPETLYQGGAGVPGPNSQGNTGTAPTGNGGGAYRRQSNYVK